MTSINYSGNSTFHQYVESVINVFLANSIMTHDSSLCQDQKA